MIITITLESGTASLKLLDLGGDFRNLGGDFPDLQLRLTNLCHT